MKKEAAKALNSMMLATAAMIDLEAAVKNVEAATLRGDHAAIAEARQKAHDMLDTHMDLKSDAIMAAKSLGGGQ